MSLNDNVLTFVAIQGRQAGRNYFSVMCPLKVVARIFVFDEEEVKYLYKYEPGVSNESHGIEVAKNAGIMDKVLNIAKMRSK